jgi:hypothetical protein
MKIKKKGECIIIAFCPGSFGGKYGPGDTGTRGQRGAQDYISRTKERWTKYFLQRKYCTVKLNHRKSKKMTSKIFVIKQRYDSRITGPKENLAGFFGRESSLGAGTAYRKERSMFKEA